MCGIAGIWGGAQDAKSGVERMLRAIVHRGPDGRGTLELPGGAAGMVRLALVDLSNNGQQPIWSPDGNVAILFNGEMYNFREERGRLAGYPFRSTSDTEVALALYLERGPSFVEKLRGMFALAIFDFREAGKEGPPALLLARDPFGIKPLYVAQRGSRVVFASELKALLASGLVEPDVDPAGVVDFLTHGFVIQPTTMLRGVRALEPGTVELFAPGRAPAKTVFYELPHATARREALGEAAERVRAAIDDSIRLHAFADAKVGAFLSGGIDSAIVAASMQQYVPDLHTFTLAFPDQPGIDEAFDARQTAAALGTRHFEAAFTGDDVAHVFPQFCRDLDQPSIDGLNTWLVSSLARRHVKGVLSGLGGDEWFAGYPVTRRMVRFAREPARSALRLAGGVAERVAPLMPSPTLRGRAENLAARVTPLATWAHGHRVFSPHTAERLAGWRGSSSLRRLDARVPASWRSPDESALGLSCLFDVRVYMGSQLLRDSDATSMGHSLELRVPFVDVAVASAARACADEHKLDAAGRGPGKRVLIEAMRSRLPAEVFARKKRGFALPFSGWMAGALAERARHACEPRTLSARGLVDPSALEAPASPSAWPQLWALLVLETWCAEVLDAARPTEARSAA